MSDYDIKDINDEIDFREFFHVLLLNKKFILLSTTFFFLLFFLYSLIIPNKYTAISVLSPAAMNSSDNLSNQYGNLAAITGISLSGDSNEVEIALAFIKSKKLVSQLMKNETFLPDLMAARKWDMKTNTLYYDTSKFDKNKKSWIRNVKPPLNKTPSIQEAYLEFSKLISVTQDTSNQFVTLTVEHISPVVAQKWALWIVKESNAMVANIRVEESQNSIDYITDQINKTPYAELRTMFYELIQQKTQDMMIAKVNSEYALTTIDPPLIPETKSKPMRTLISILGLCVGFILSVIIIIIRYYSLNITTELNILRWKKL